MKRLFKQIFNLPGSVILLVAVINILLNLLPLTNLIGYEISALNGILISVGGSIGYIHFRRVNKGNYPFEIILRTDQYFFLLILTIPLLISLLNTVLLQGCPVYNGIYFYILITIPSLFYGIWLAEISFILSKKFSYLIFIFLYSISLLLFILEIFYNPQIYFYNPIFGYFPGTIYDEDIPIDQKFILFRLFIFAFAILSTFGINRVVKRKKILRISLIFFTIIFYILFFTLKSSFGLATTLSSVRDDLEGEIFSPHFNTIYSLSIPHSFLTCLYYYGLISLN